MPEFSLKFDTDNAAFTEDGEWEVASILERTATLVKNGYKGGGVLDSNGNNVGSWSLELPEPENDDEDEDDDV